MMKVTINSRGEVEVTGSYENLKPVAEIRAQLKEFAVEHEEAVLYKCPIKGNFLKTRKARRDWVLNITA